jgi:hypothetical protein
MKFVDSVWLVNSGKEYSNGWSIVSTDFKYNIGDKLKFASNNVDVIKKIVYEKDKTILHTVKGKKLTIK